MTSSARARIDGGIVSRGGGPTEQAVCGDQTAGSEQHRCCDPCTLAFDHWVRGEIDKEASRGYLPGMRTVGLKILKNKLSEYVRLAATGETIVITDRNRAVAEIVPIRRQEESFVERGVREGWLTPATDRSGRPPPRKPIEGYSFEQLMADLERDREDSF
jgi:prevent-host-death family protein